MHQYDETKPNQGFLDGLKSISPDLAVVFCEYALAHPGGPFILGDYAKNPSTGAPLIKGRWHVVQKDIHGRVWHLFEICNEDGGFRPPDNRTLETLHNDILHQLMKKGMSREKAADEMVKFVMENREAQKEKARKELEQKEEDWLKANKRKVEEAVENSNLGANKGSLAPGETKPSKTYSFEGQKNHTSSAERPETLIPAREAGWEQIPEWSDDQ